MLNTFEDLRINPALLSVRGRLQLRDGAARHRQGGFSLIVALLMLIVIIILGVGASQMAINEERGARSDRDKQIAFQAAEAALKDAEFEILSPTSPLCGGQPGHARPGTNTCFNEINVLGFVPNCSRLPNAGLCDYNAERPVWVDETPAHIDFYKDAAGTGDGRTVGFGHYTARKFGAQQSSDAAQTPLGSNFPISKYPPRYIIESVPKNTSLDSVKAESTPHMFRITAMGFGANANTQVVLQSVVATEH